MTDPRRTSPSLGPAALAAVTLGFAALVAGIVGVVADAAVLGAIAGALGLLAGLVPLVLRSGVADHAALDARAPAPAPLPAPVALADGSVTDAAATTAAATGVDTSLIDPETGLFNDDFFRVAVETRVLAARRHLRPVAIVLFSVTEAAAGAERPAPPGPVADAIRETLREADTACRLADGRFGFVLEDTPEDGAIWTVERLRRTLATSTGEVAHVRRAGIACYPAHAFNAQEALTKAEDAYAAARDWLQDRIEVASAD